MQALWMLFASAMFAIMGASVKMAGDLPLPQIITIRSLPMGLAMLIWAMRTHRKLAPPDWRMHVQRNVAGVASMWMGFYATVHLPLATATALAYTSPLFIAGWVLWQTGVPDRARMMAVLLGFVGVLVLLRPTLTEEQFTPALVGLTGGGLMAVAYLGLRALGQAGEPEWRTVMYFALCSTLSGLLMLPVTGWVWPTATGWLALLGVAVAGMGGQLAVTRAFGRGSPLVSAALQYSTIVFSAGLGFFLWGDAPDTMGWIGMGLVVFAGLISTWRTTRRPA